MSSSKQTLNEKQVTRDRKVIPRSLPASASAYNPFSGTFCPLESVIPYPGIGSRNGRFSSIDNVDDPATPTGVGADVESMSSNGSCSGESEDQLHLHQKEKLEVGNLVGDVDKRDKIRGKNERKHRRQKERRAQELRDKCNGYLMSRKLEALSQQLVTMGFSQEQATMALIVNDGNVEQSVAWLLEGAQDEMHQDWNTGGSPKIDISEELVRIHDVEKNYGVSRAEIERAIVLWEGDMDKALDFVQDRILDRSPGHTESHKFHCTPSNVSMAKSKEELVLSDPGIPCSSSVTHTEVDGVHQMLIKTRSKGRELMCTTGNSGSSDALVKEFGRNVSSLPNSLTSSLGKGYSQVAGCPLKSSLSSHISRYTHAAAGSRVEPVLMHNSRGIDSTMGCLSARDPLERKSFKKAEITKEVLCIGKDAGVVSPLPMSSPPLQGRGSRAIMPPSRISYPGSASGNGVFYAESSDKPLVDNLNLGLSGLQGHYHLSESTHLNCPVSDGDLLDRRSSNQDWGVSLLTSLHSGGDSQTSSMTSLGLYTGWGTGHCHSSVDWNMGPLTNCDYRNIDWSMSATPPSTAKADCLWGHSDNLGSMKLQGRGISCFNMEETRGCQAVSENARLGMTSNFVCGVKNSMPARLEVQDKTCIEYGKSAPIGVHEWTSPFAGKDLFSLPLLVPSPSL